MSNKKYRRSGNKRATAYFAGPTESMSVITNIHHVDGFGLNSRLTIGAPHAAAGFGCERGAATKCGAPRGAGPAPLSCEPAGLLAGIDGMTVAPCSCETRAGC